MKIIKSIIILSLVLFATQIIGQELPETYQEKLNGIVTNFESIRGSTSIKDGKNSIRILSADKVVLSVEHKRKIKNLTFKTQKDEEGNLIWVSANSLTFDMIDKYNDFVTGVLEKMLKLSKEKAEE